jgi:Tol biopolymer transport system component
VELSKVLVSYPSWSRDGKYIYFDSPFADDPALYRVRISDHKLERLVSLKGFQRSGSYNWFGIAADDSPMVVRYAGTREIYALDWDAP